MNPYKYDFKDQSPIRFEFFQSEMEKIMFALEEAKKMSVVYDYENKNYVNNNLLRLLSNIKEDLQHKINIHKERGEWK